MQQVHGRPSLPAVAELEALGSIEYMNLGLVLICLVALLPIYELDRAIRALRRRDTLRVVVTEFLAAAVFGILAFLFFWYLWSVGVFTHLF